MNNIPSHCRRYTSRSHRHHAKRHRLSSRPLTLEALEARQLLCATLGKFDSLPPGMAIATAHVDARAYHHETIELTGSPSANDSRGAADSSTTNGTLRPLSDLPILHSNASARVKLYLDFNGHFQAQWGGYTNITTPVYDSDGDSTTFSDAELNAIFVAWSIVAEDFAPFNIDVTTDEPLELAAGVPESDANGVALRVAIGGNSRDWTGGDYGGLAYIDNFTNTIANVVYVFPAGTANGTTIGGTSSHEAGHAFGLWHQSIYDQNGVKIFEYAPGVGNWGPIMGSTGGAPITTWQYGTSSAGPTTYQDDMAVLARSANSFGYRSDDYGNTLTTATPLTSVDGTWTGTGIIETNTDIDVFSFMVTTEDSYRVDLDVAPIGPNLHAVMQLRDSAGSLIAATNPVAGVGASIAAVLASNATYFVSVGKTSDYGRVGAYKLNVFAPPAGITVAAPPRLTTREGGPAESFTVKLDTQPTANVVIPVSSSNIGEAVVSTESLVFTPANWNTPQTVLVAPVDDGMRDGDAGFTMVLGPAVSDDVDYSGLDATDVAAVNLDGASAGWLYWIDNANDVINSSTFNGLNVHTVVDLKALFGLADYVPRYLAVDPPGGKMYWTDSGTGRIQRADLNGSHVETLMSGFTNGGLRGIAVDSAGGTIYWVDFAAQKIQRANLDGSGVQDVITGALSGVREITLDTAAGKIYWGDYGESNIRRANLDGSNIEVLWQGVDADNPTAIALDTTVGKMYWADAGSDKILRANLNGSNVEELIDMHSFYADATVSSLSVDAAAGKIYFSDFGNKAVLRANLDGSDVVTIASDATSVIQGIALLYPSVTVTPSTGLVTTESGGSAAFRIRLTTPPKANVTIPLSSSNPQEGFPAQSSITFTPANWNVPQMVTVVGVDDGVADGNKAYTIVLGPANSTDADYAGIDPPDVSVTNIDQNLKYYVVDDGSPDRSFQYLTDGSASDSTTLAAGNSAPRGVASSAGSNKTLVLNSNRTVYVYDTAGALLGSWTAGTLPNNATPEGIATDGTDVWIVDARSDKVYRYTGAASRLTGSQNAASSFSLNSGNLDPSDIVTDGTSLWVTNNSTSDRVFKYSLAGTLLGSWTIDPTNSNPSGIALDPISGSDLLIADGGTDRVYLYAGASGRTSGSQSATGSFTLASGNYNPQGIAVVTVASPPAVSVADLAVASSAVSSTMEGNVVTFNLTVTNNGPASATSVVLTDALGPNWAYNSATVSQGTVQQSGNIITFNIGTVAVGQTVSAQIQATALEPGDLTNSVSVAGSSSDYNLANNSAVNAISVAAAPIVVSGSPLTVSGKKLNNITTATFTHANAVHPASYYVATIHWGDGSTSAGSISLSGTTYTVKGSHTYWNNGTYTVTTSVARAGSGAGRPASLPLADDGFENSSAGSFTASVAPGASAIAKVVPGLLRDALLVPLGMTHSRSQLRSSVIDHLHDSPTQGSDSYDVLRLANADHDNALNQAIEAAFAIVGSQLRDTHKFALDLRKPVRLSRWMIGGDEAPICGYDQWHPVFCLDDPRNDI